MLRCFTLPFRGGRKLFVIIITVAVPCHRVPSVQSLWKSPEVTVNCRVAYSSSRSVTVHLFDAAVIFATADKAFRSDFSLGHSNSTSIHPFSVCGNHSRGGGRCPSVRHKRNLHIANMTIVRRRETTLRRTTDDRRQNPGHLPLSPSPATIFRIKRPPPLQQWCPARNNNTGGFRGGGVPPPPPYWLRLLFQKAAFSRVKGTYLVVRICDKSRRG